MYTAHEVFPFAHNWVDSLLETLEWRTDVLSGETGMEQRVSRRLTPRRSFEASFLLNKDGFRAFQLFVQKNNSREFLLPVWHEVRSTWQDVEGSIQVTVVGGGSEYEEADFFIFRGESWNTWEAYEVSTVAGSSLALWNDGLTSLDREWPVGSIAYPGVLVRLDEVPKFDKITDQTIKVTARFTTTRPARFPSDLAFDLYGDMPVLLQRPDESDELSLGFVQSLSEVDNLFGIRRVHDNYGRPAQTLQYRWSVIGSDNLRELRKLLYWLRGRTRMILVPTFMEDLKSISPTVQGTTALYVSNVGYARREMHTKGRELLMIELVGGSILFRTVTDSVEVSDSSEMLTLDTPWNYSVPVEDILRISYLIPCRLDQDSVEISHPTDTVGVSHSKVTWREVLGSTGSIDAYPPGIGETALWRGARVTEGIVQGGLYNGIQGLHFIPEINSFVGVELFGSEGQLVSAMYLVDPDTLAVTRHIGDVVGVEIPESNQADSLTQGLPEPLPTVVYSSGYVVFMANYYVYNAGTEQWNPVTGFVQVDPTNWSYTLISGVVPGLGIYANPYDGDIYMYSYNSYSGMYRFSMNNLSVVKQTYQFNGPAVQPLSEWGDYYASQIYQADADGVIYDLRGDAYVFMSNLHFTSADTAYMQEYRSGYFLTGLGFKNDLYRIDLTQGRAIFQFTYYPPNNAISQSGVSRVLGFDEPTRTLWMSSVLGLFSWPVGRSPANLRFHTNRRAQEMLPNGTPGLQSFSNAYCSASFDRANRQVWQTTLVDVQPDTRIFRSEASYATFMPYATFATDDYFYLDAISLDTKRYTATARLEIPDISQWGPQNTPNIYGPLLQFTNDSKAWTHTIKWNSQIGQYFHEATYIELDSVRAPPTSVRFVRLTISANRFAWDGGVISPGISPVGLQGVQIRRSPNGKPVPIRSVYASASDAGYPASNLLNGDHVNPENSWRTSELPVTLVFELYDPTSVYEIALFPINSFAITEAEQNIQHLAIYGMGQQNRRLGPETAPSVFTLETSVDGEVWGTPVGYSGIKGWAVGLGGLEAQIREEIQYLEGSAAADYLLAPLRTLVFSGAPWPGNPPCSPRVFDLF